MDVTVKRMQQLIEDLLSYSRVKNALHFFEKTDLNTIAKEVSADFEETGISEKKAIIEFVGLCEVNTLSVFSSVSYS